MSSSVKLGQLLRGSSGLCSCVRAARHVSSVPRLRIGKSWQFRRRNPEVTKHPLLMEHETCSAEDVDKILKNFENDEPVPDMPNPYEKEHKRCILCKYNIDLDYKNVRLLNQFISPYTGQIYGRQITGLCVPMQKHVSRLIKKARIFGFMPYLFMDLRFLEDPNLCNPFKSKKL